ncbi:glucose 1-dehydrogenase [Pedobacter miscanthi]|jgi:NAD(P)-dependent dehydrogenase (short-subunit alcohol dehydrogenase family)|uniref:Short-chain dehydrogenase n=1 Tax=Pedobacter miscanthi TaxID=2259170 RepID=A0A366L026_9SPHI|nr:glucose 1-dehydrogenase [Pedobacter miscanthi]RBQ06839.1 short-chain dehydrogenase [Pedobacter miscanthi]
MSNLKGKTALVTGASRGIGRYTAERLAKDGARVGVHYGQNKELALETVAAIEANGGSAFAIHADLSLPHAAETLWKAFDEHADKVDILVNNAGEVVYGTIREIVEEDFARLFTVNVKSPLFIIQQGLSRINDGGRIINLSSAAAYMASPMATMYSATKGAISTLTRTLAWDLGDRQITVNAVAPGFTDTDMSSWFANPGAREWAAGQSALGRVGQPSDIGDIIAFLASEDGRWVNGQTIDATGGGLLGVTKAG